MLSGVGGTESAKGKAEAEAEAEAGAESVFEFDDYDCPVIFESESDLRSNRKRRKMPGGLSGSIDVEVDTGAAAAAAASSASAGGGASGTTTSSGAPPPRSP